MAVKYFKIYQYKLLSIKTAQTYILVWDLVCETRCKITYTPPSPTDKPDSAVPSPSPSDLLWSNFLILKQNKKTNHI